MKSIVYIPALIFWIPFAFCFSIANKIYKPEFNAEWHLFGIEAVDLHFYIP